MLSARTLATALALLCAASCGGEILKPPGGNFIPALAPAYARWNDMRPASYDFTLQFSCFCGQDFTRAVNVSVRGGVVTSRRYADDGSPVNPQLAAAFTDIDGLFGKLASAYSNNAASIATTFDSGYGFPTSAFIDYAANVADDELGFSVSNFAPR